LACIGAYPLTPFCKNLDDFTMRFLMNFLQKLKQRSSHNLPENGIKKGVPH
jgi:hypothetical protein